MIAWALAMLPGLGTFRWSFRWLPLAFLAVALVAAQALSQLRSRLASRDTAPEPERPPNLGLWCLGLVLPLGLLAWLTGMEPQGHILVQTAILSAAAVLWAVVEQLTPEDSGMRRWAPCAVVLVSLWSVYRDVGRFVEFAAWDFDETVREAGPLDPGRRYLSVHDLRDIIAAGEPGITNWNRGIGTGLRPGNAWMYAGVEAVNGYSPMAPAGLYDVFQFISHMRRDPEDAARVLEQWSGPNGLLRATGVDGLIVARRYDSYTGTLRQNGWEFVARVDGGTVYHRVGSPAPRARAVESALLMGNWDDTLHHLREERGGHTPLLTEDLAGPGKGESRLPRALRFRPAEVRVLREGRNSLEVDVGPFGAEGEALILFARPWFPGYRATLNGEPVPVTVVDLTMVGVRIPGGGSGRLLVEYRPCSLVVGCWLAGAALGAAVLALGAAAFFRKVRASDRA